MKLNDLSTAFTFDDVMLEPRQSRINSRKEPSPFVQLGKWSPLTVPIISSPMNTVTESAMADAMLSLGADAVIHRYMSIKEQVDMFYDVQRGDLRPENQTNVAPWVAVGAAGDFRPRVVALHDAGARKFCIDVANGHNEHCIEAVRYIKRFSPHSDIMAGNVCTYWGAHELVDAGANVVRVGIGPGSMCITRIVTGHGVPQMTAIERCADVKSHNPHVSIVADGGMRSSGDIVKAIAIGADAVMLGGLLAGTSQTPGETIRDPDGSLYKMYNGMASEEGRKNWFDKEATSFVPEGSSTKVAFKGDVKKIIEQLVGGLRVGMSISDALTLDELRSKARWVRVTENGKREGNPNKRMYR